jgi:hypothetical protein
MQEGARGNLAPPMSPPPAPIKRAGIREGDARYADFMNFPFWYEAPK